MREELHERLEAMVLDVEDVINSGERADEQKETLETDELWVALGECKYILLMGWQIQAEVPKFRGSVRNARAAVHITPAVKGSRDPIAAADAGTAA